MRNAPWCATQRRERASRAGSSEAGPEFVDAVAEAIAQHRFRGNRSPTTLEARVVHDADKLDALGAIGVARAYAVAGRHNAGLWADLPPCRRSEVVPRATWETQETGRMRHTPVHEYVYELSRLPERMFTRTGRELAVERHRYMAGFFERLAREVGGVL